jgi:hypothetical protein
MENIIEYRDDQPPVNEYPRRIVSPTQPSRCCAASMEEVGQHAKDASWRFFYKRCAVCGYTVRHIYAPSLVSVLDAGREIRLALAEMNLGTGRRKRRTQAEIAQEIATALAHTPSDPQAAKSTLRCYPPQFRHRKALPSAA